VTLTTQKYATGLTPDAPVPGGNGGGIFNPNAGGGDQSGVVDAGSSSGGGFFG
jgi:hypothetical protein